MQNILNVFAAGPRLFLIEGCHLAPNSSYDAADCSRRNVMLDSAKPRLNARLLDLTSLVLQVSTCHKVIDRVTTTLGYADLSMRHPEIPRFHNEVLRSLHRLSETLEAEGQRELALRVRSFVAENRYLEASRLLSD
jgi:hypothetical protein